MSRPGAPGREKDLPEILLAKLRNESDDSYCQEQARGSRCEHFYREVCDKYQHYAASNRRDNQHQGYDEVEAQCAERVKGGEQHQ